jgi:hypothetical protein
MRGLVIVEGFNFEEIFERSLVRLDSVFRVDSHHGPRRHLNGQFPLNPGGE